MSRQGPTRKTLGPAWISDSAPGITAPSSERVQLTTGAHKGPPALAVVPTGTQTSEPPCLRWWVVGHRPGLSTVQWVFVFPGGPAQPPEESGPF